MGAFYLVAIFITRYILRTSLFDRITVFRAYEKLIQIITYFELELNLIALAFTHAFEMATFATLHAPAHAHIGSAPHLQTPALPMSHIVALIAGEHPDSRAFGCLMADSVTLETEFFIAFE